MVSMIVLVAMLLALVVSVLFWATTKRMLTAGHPKDISVSRQWLLQHQDDDRS